MRRGPAQFSQRGEVTGLVACTLAAHTDARDIDFVVSCGLVLPAEYVSRDDGEQRGAGTCSANELSSVVRCAGAYHGSSPVV